MSAYELVCIKSPFEPFVSRRGKGCNRFGQSSNNRYLRVVVPVFVTEFNSIPELPLTNSRVPDYVSYRPKTYLTVFKWNLDLAAYQNFGVEKQWQQFCFTDMFLFSIAIRDDEDRFCRL